LYAAEAAVRIADALVNATEYDLGADIRKMKEIREDVRLGPSTGSLVDEAVAREIPWIRLGIKFACSVGLRCESNALSGNHHAKYKQHCR
jgi:cyanophycin synthetase